MTLHLPLHIWQQLNYFVQLNLPQEITGAGTITLLDRESFCVDQLFLPQQIVSPVYCEFAEGALNDLIFDLIEDNPSRVKDLRFRWHSHAKGEVFWSNIDERDIEHWEASWAVNLVLNARQDYLARLDIYDPFRVVNIPLDVVIDYPDDPDLLSHCRAALRQKVQVRPGFTFRNTAKEDEIC